MSGGLAFRACFLKKQAFLDGSMTLGLERDFQIILEDQF